jgi:hypothetical protein
VPPVWWLVVSVYGCWTALYAIGSPWLMLPFYSSYLIPFTFVALGRIAVTSLEPLSAAAYSCVLAAVFVLGGMGYRLAPSANVGVAVTIAVGCVVAATLLRLRPRWQTSPAFPFLLIGAVVSMNAITADYGPQLWNGYGHTAMTQIYAPTTSTLASQVTRSERFESAVASAERLGVRLSGNSGRQYFFWYDGNDELGSYYRSVTSLLFAWSTNNLLGEDFRGFDEQNRRSLAAFSDSGMRDLVVLCRQAGITPPDRRFTVQWTQAESVGGVPYFIHYLAYHPTTDAPVQ